MRTLLLCALLTAGSPALAAPVRLEFWHAMDGVKGLIEQYAREFNQSQTDFEVVPVSQGNYRELLPKFQAAIAANKAPALAQLEFTQYPALAARGELQNLGKAVSGLPQSLIGDLYAPAWQAGEVNGERYALPWNISVPVLLYNAGTLQRTRLKVPVSWAELEAEGAALAPSGKRPLVATPDTWTFEANVRSRGGQLVRGNAPTLNAPEAVTALAQLSRMTQKGQGQARTLGEAGRAAFDFARGYHTFVLASVANWNSAKGLPFFKLGMAPFPCEQAGCTVPLGGAALVMPRNVSAQQQAGALAFWQFLMDPARQAQWVKSTAYAPVRRSVRPLLSDWYQQNPPIKAAHAQMDRAEARPTLPRYGEWSGYLEEAIWQAITGKQTAQAALDEAQRKALK